MNRPRYPRLSLDLLRGFHAAARHLSFTRAARELFVTQPAISRAIKTLEERLGKPLFHRANRTLQLTHAGEELYRAVDEALALIDATTRRLTGSARTLAVTTTSALASTWLAPKLPQFIRLHPKIDVRLAATNDMVDLEREHIDIAIRFVPLGADIPKGEWFVDYKTFPICSSQLVRGARPALRAPDDLARYVLLDFETVLYGWPWSDWGRWFDAMKLSPIKPESGTLHFSHYDQAIQAAVDGSGVAIGKWPHLSRHLRDGVLRAPLGRDWVASLGSYHIVAARGASGEEPVAAFVAWLKAEIRRDEERMPVALLRPRR